MSRRRIKLKDEIPVSFRLPADVQRILIQKAESEDLNFSQIVRRSLRRELEDAGVSEKKETVNED